jgi:hypothetical protein
LVCKYLPSGNPVLHGQAAPVDYANR